MLGGSSVFFFFFFFFYWKTNFFPNERRREARVHEVTRLISVVPHWYARTRLFFYFLVLYFEPSCWVTVFLLFLFFTCIFNSLCNFSHYKFGRAIFTHFRWQKKKAAKRWPCYSGEWKQARHDKYLSLLLDVFSVWKPWHWGIKKKWKGEEREREREREKILPKRGGGGVKASLNDFFAPERRQEKDRPQSGHFKVKILSSLAAHIFLLSLDFPISHHHSPMQGMKGHEMWAIVHRHYAAGLLVHMTRQGETLTAGVFIPVWVQ